jgi:hypothetical protein
MRKFYLFILFISVILSCNNIDSTEPSPLNAFIRFYEGPYSLTARSIEKIPDGFVILATMVSGSVSDPVIQTVLIETDEKGIRRGDFRYFNNIIGKSFKPIISNGSVEGYVIVGDKIVIDPLAEQAANVSISAMEILILNPVFGEVAKRSLSDKRELNDNHPVADDYFGASVTVSEDGSKIYLLGTFKKGIINQQSAPEEQLLFGLDNNLDSAWVKYYPLLGNTFLNSKSIHEDNGNIVWASAVADIQGDFTSSYVAIPFVPVNSFPVNYSMIGQNTSQLYLPSDIQPSSTPGFGFGVTGTYSSNTDGSEGNIFFLQVDAQGNIIPGSERFFDGEVSMEGEVTDKNASTVVDNGESLISTKDGGFAIVGTMTNTSTKDKDLMIIKVNAFGDKQWIKRFGASGDEVPISVKEADNGDLLICGTNTLGNYSTIFLMRTDSNGELKN